MLHGTENGSDRSFLVPMALSCFSADFVLLALLALSSAAGCSMMTSLHVHLFLSSAVQQEAGDRTLAFAPFPIQLVQKNVRLISCKRLELDHLKMSDYHFIVQ